MDPTIYRGRIPIVHFRRGAARLEQEASQHWKAPQKSTSINIFLFLVRAHSQAKLCQFFVFFMIISALDASVHDLKA
jgi:hypothetical protein